MTTLLSDSLASVEAELVRIGHETLPDAFRPGLSSVEITAMLTADGLTPTSELLTLYGWHDGVGDFDALGDVWLLPGFYFASLATALGSYRMFRELAEDTPELGEFSEWSASWLPFMQNGFGDYLVVDLTDGSVIESLHAEPRQKSTQFESVADLFDKIARGLQAGVIVIGEDGMLDADTDIFDRFVAGDDVTELLVAAAAADKVTPDAASTPARVPKKFRDRCALLRDRYDEAQLPSYEEFAVHPAQVSAVRAQAALFSLDWPQATTLLRRTMDADRQDWSGNFWSSAFAATVFLAGRSQAEADASAWLDGWLGRLASRSWPEHLLSTFEYQVESTKGILSAGPQQVDWHPTAPEPMETFVAKLATYRKRVDPASLEGANYMLHFIPETGNPDDFLDLYHRFHDDAGLSEGHRITAARILAARGETAAAREAILLWARLGWYRIEVTDILPLSLLDHVDLHPIITDDLLLRIRDR